MDGHPLSADRHHQEAAEAICVIGDSSRAPLRQSEASDPRTGWTWVKAFHPLLGRAARAPRPASAPTNDQSEKSRQLVKVGQLVRHFKGEWKILKNRRLHSDGREYCVDVVMMHEDHGIALISVSPIEYTLPDLAIRIVRDILKGSRVSGLSLSGLPIVFMSAHERSMRDMAEALVDAFSANPLVAVGRWERQAYKTLASRRYDRLPDDFGAEIINPSSAGNRDRRDTKVLPVVPAPVLLYVACSSVGVVAGIALTAAIFLL